MDPCEKKAQKCLSIEDNAEAFACVKRVIAEGGKGCQPRLVLLSNENCDPCSEEMAHHKKDIDAGLIHVIPFTSPEGVEIAKKNNIDYVPSVLLLDCHNLAMVPEGYVDPPAEENKDV